MTVLQDKQKLKSSRSLPFHTRRDAWVEVNLGALESNAQTIRQFVPPAVQIMAVLKADAYGHGAVMVVPTLEASGISMIGVASVDEALQLRQAGVTLPILVLGVTPDWAMHDAVENSIAITIFSDLHLESLKRLYDVTGIAAQVHIKVDTGMHRIGINWEQSAAWITRCQTLPFIHVEGVFSHLAHTADKAFTQTQFDRWSQVIGGLTQKPSLLHLSSSAGVWHYPTETMNMVRAGIALFGYEGDQLKPVMGLKARIVHLQALPPGEGVSYGQTFINQSDTPIKIATLPLGYADGIPRGLSNRIEGLCQGQSVKQVGTISMDQLMVDVTGLPDAQIGDVVTLLGGNITLEDWSQILQTIPYELMCALRVRLPKVAVR